jgi:hypothetical protein
MKLRFSIFGLRLGNGVDALSASGERASDWRKARRVDMPFLSYARTQATDRSGRRDSAACPDRNGKDSRRLALERESAYLDGDRLSAQGALHRQLD